jgi:acetyltransferase-like isoleucine patch superfamily enzyme
MKNWIRRRSFRLLGYFIPEIHELKWLRAIKGSSIVPSKLTESEAGNANIFAPYTIVKSKIGKGTYIARNSFISFCEIGKFCSIGPNVICGWGIHPTNGLSTSPVFYSTQNQAGFHYAKQDKITERAPITIGNDVFIGMNVTILDGITIGNGAIIGAGAVVSKNIPAYAVAYGSPIQIVRFRFSDEQITALEKIKWWDFDDEKILEVEKHFFDIDGFINKYKQEN